MRVLFVCMGNICRSPTAEAIFRDKLAKAGLFDRIVVDSAGTGDWHVGKAPDPRSIQEGAKRGYDLSGLRARQITAEDFRSFDLILAMDHENMAFLSRLRPSNASAEVDLLLRRYGLEQDEVPDPYFGGVAGFKHVIDLLEKACEALVHEVRGPLEPYCT
ncbi:MULTISPECIES: low molecular weight protein-tyrosine-phosphatase [unclassified Pseudomonas]|uniref:low molecular weight protein-tyrosine-phosphatase n=1 Tax=unclassified Pseudomonas TaxID=196821 RepID=UPI00257BCE1C|nr:MULTISPECIES: low molecular weight protein-tyrosine-phosphatase [unclassified Pseudomonas]